MRRTGRAAARIALVLVSVASSVACTRGRAENASAVPTEAGPKGRNASPARGQPPAVTERSAEGSAVDGFVRWCASGGAPIVGQPVLDDRERAYVATSDGYLHAFERDGRFRWSYTVKGTPLGSVSIRPNDGAILIGTTAQRIYAIQQGGGLGWSFSTLTPVWSGLFALNPSTVVFLGHDQRLYALGNNGAAKYRVKAPSDPMGDPVIAADDVVWVPLVDGVARFEAAFKLERFPLPHPIEQVVVLGDGIVARGGGQAYFVAGGGEVTPLGPARLISSDDRHAVLVDEEEQVTLISTALEKRQLAPFFEVTAAQIAAPPTLQGDLLWTSLSDGTVRVVDVSRDDDARRIVVGRGSWTSPVVGHSGAWALVPSAGGEFCAVELSQSPSPAR